MVEGDKWELYIPSDMACAPAPAGSRSRDTCTARPRIARLPCVLGAQRIDVCPRSQTATAAARP